MEMATLAADPATAAQGTVRGGATSAMPRAPSTAMSPTRAGQRTLKNVRPTTMSNNNRSKQPPTATATTFVAGRCREAVDSTSVNLEIAGPPVIGHGQHQVHDQPEVPRPDHSFGGSGFGRRSDVSCPASAESDLRCERSRKRHLGTGWLRRHRRSRRHHGRSACHEGGAASRKRRRPACRSARGRQAPGRDAPAMMNRWTTARRSPGRSTSPTSCCGPRRPRSHGRSAAARSVSGASSPTPPVVTSSVGSPTRCCASTVRQLRRAGSPP